MATHTSTTQDFSEDSFWATFRRAMATAGRPVLETALKLYYAWQSPDTPAWAKAVIASALAYFIWPLDAIPDALPLVGWTDDAAALASALITVAAHVTPEMAARAKRTVDAWAS